MGDDVLSIKHWLYSLTGIETASLKVPKDFVRPTWFVEEPQRIPEPTRPDGFRERVTMHLTLLAKTNDQLKSVVQQVRSDLAERRWILPLYGVDQVQSGFMRECRLTFGQASGLDQLVELRYLVYIPYTPVEYSPLEEINTKLSLKGGE